MQVSKVGRVLAVGFLFAVMISAWATHSVGAQGAPGAQGGGRGRGAAPSPYPITQASQSRFEKIADGVYYGTGSNGGNSPVFVGDRDVIVMDTKTTPAAARVFLEDLKMVTNGKPVRYAVNSHYHYDHADGNQVFRAAGIDVIGHEFIKFSIENYDILHREPFMTSQVVNGTRRIDTAKKNLAEEKDPAKKPALEAALAAAQKNWDDLQEVKPTPPNITFKDKKVIDLGGREVQLLFLGRGHTNGDTLMYLPKEKIMATGDLMEEGPAYMGDGQMDEWIATLEVLKNMDIQIILPGHGAPFTDVKPRITAFQGYLRDIVKQVAEFRKQGVLATDAAQKVDLSAYKAFFPQTARPGAELRSVRHIYEWLYDQEHKK